MADSDSNSKSISDKQTKNFISRIFSHKKEGKNKLEEKKDSRKSSPGKKIGKILLWILGAIVALLILILIFLDSVLHFAVTTVGSSIIGAPITVDEIELSISDGTLDIINLKVANSEKFDSPSMLELGAFHLSLDSGSIFSDEIIIHNIEVHKLHVTAVVNEAGQMNFLTLIEELQEKFPPSEKEEEPSAPGPKVMIEKFSLENFKFSWLDARRDFNINGFGASLDKISGSLTEGRIELNSFVISNPDNYDISHMLKIASISTTLDPDSLNSPAVLISSVQISGMQAQAEFNTDGEFNILDVVESFQNLLPAEDTVQEEDDIEKNEEIAEENISGEEEEPSPKLEYFLLSDSSFALRDDRIKIPVAIPLYVEKSDQVLIINDTDVLETMHEYAIWLRDQCTGVTDGGDLVFKFIGDGAGTGLKLLEETGKTGVQLLQNTNQSGKQVINDLINVFK